MEKTTNSIITFPGYSRSIEFDSMYSYRILSIKVSASCTEYFFFHQTDVKIMNFPFLAIFLRDRIVEKIETLCENRAIKATLSIVFQCSHPFNYYLQLNAPNIVIFKTATPSIFLHIFVATFDRRGKIRAYSTP